MEGLHRMVKSIEYLEDNLHGEIKVERAAEIAYMSKFHFQRMFHMLTGFTMKEYVRNRRLTLAAAELANGGVKVIDVALKYGYESPESFSKAFRKLHGVSPVSVRQNRQPLKAFPRLSFQIQIKGGTEMEYRIQEKPAFELVGKGIETRTAFGENHRDILAFWEETNREGWARKLDWGELGLIGACMDFDNELETMTYFIGVVKSSDTNLDGMTVKSIPAASWAIFPVNGAMPDAIRAVWERIFSEWFPSTGYEHSGGPELEVYPSGGDPHAEDYYSEIWIPILKK